jgi:hypothetical protein
LIRFKVMRGQGPNEGKWAVFRINPDDSEDLVETHGAEWYARHKAAMYQWATHLDSWMASLVEDNDVVEDVMEILGAMQDIPFDSDDEELINKEYDKGVARALAELPDAMKLLAERYRKEWNNRRPQQPRRVETG